MLKAFLRLLFGTVVALFALSVVLVVLLRWVAPPLTSFMAQTWVDQLMESGRPAEIRFSWVAFDRISPNLALAVVAAEDQRFPGHHGFDWASIRSAIERKQGGGRLRGASTITQQVAKNLFLWPGRSYLRKGLEAYLTILIELIWPKRRILEMYLNVAQMGPTLFGARAASERYFRKTPDRLDAAQAALLAAVLPNPLQLQVQAPSGYVRKRQQWIMQQMRALGGPSYLADL